jgi:hypothetical protein
MFHFHRRKKRSACVPSGIFTREEMAQLVRFRQRFVPDGNDAPPSDPEQQRLAFTHWLFVTGKLNETG